MNINDLTIIRNLNTKSKLTVGFDGKVRIKLAIGITSDEEIIVIDRLSDVASVLLVLNLKKTFRGKYGKNCITMYNDSKKIKKTFKWKS